MVTTFVHNFTDSVIVAYLVSCAILEDSERSSNVNNFSAFGGNYDEYFRAVVEFFVMLRKCNITPYVLLDGGYEMRKMKTTKERLRSRIGVIKYIIPLESYLAIPLQMREVFVSAVKSCNVKLYRCFFEADNEIGELIGHKRHATRSKNISF